MGPSVRPEVRRVPSWCAWDCVACVRRARTATTRRTRNRRRRQGHPPHRAGSTDARCSGRCAHEQRLPHDRRHAPTRARQLGQRSLLQADRRATRRAARGASLPREKAAPSPAPQPQPPAEPPPRRLGTRGGNAHGEHPRTATAACPSARRGQASTARRLDQRPPAGVRGGHSTRPREAPATAPTTALPAGRVPARQMDAAR